jgi:acyl carrier protein
MDKRTKIVDIVRSFATEPINPAPGDSLFESGLLDSFSLADLVSALEKEFSIRIPDADLQPRKFDSVERIEAYVESRM